MRGARLLSLTVLLLFVSGCSQMSYRKKVALTSAAVCGAIGAAAGGGIAHNSGDHRNSEGQGIAIGAVTGALLCGPLAYLLAEEPKPAPPPPKPAPPAPEPVPPPPPKVEAPPPPKPAPPPKVEPTPPPPLRTIVLDNVLFDFDKTAIKPDGMKILDRLVEFMNENPDTRVDLEGHTDWVGTEKYNQGLSERRADSVRRYLVQKGIRSSRLTTRGFGEGRPIADNRTTEGRAKNRRVEVKVR